MFAQPADQVDSGNSRDNHSVCVPPSTNCGTRCDCNTVYPVTILECSLSITWTMEHEFKYSSKKLLSKQCVAQVGLLLTPSENVRIKEVPTLCGGSSVCFSRCCVKEMRSFSGGVLVPCRACALVLYIYWYCDMFVHVHG